MSLVAVAERGYPLYDEAVSMDVVQHTLRSYCCRGILLTPNVVSSPRVGYLRWLGFKIVWPRLPDRTEIGE